MAHSTLLPYGEDISIFVKVAYLSEIDHPRLAISINTPAGLLVHGVNTEMKATLVPQGKKGVTTIYSFSFKNTLGKGEYLVSLWLMSEENTGVYRLDTRESALTIESGGCVSFNGLVDISINIGAILKLEFDLG